MRFGLLLFGCLLRLLAPAAAQTTVSGQVLDGRDAPLAGVTVVQRHTIHGVSSDTDGQFTLTIPERLDSLDLVISSLGYLTRQLRVAAGSHTIIALDSSRTEPVVFDIRRFRWLEFGLLPGMRYGPLGASVRFPGLWYVQPGLTYQTNLRCNHAWHGSLLSSNWSRNGQFVVRGRLEQHYVQIAPADLRFSSSTGTLAFSDSRIGPWRVPELLLTAGYARRRTLSADGPDRAGFGYGAGLRHDFRLYPLRLLVEVRATRWAGYWQLQGQLQQPLGQHYHVGVATHWLPRYREVSLGLAYTMGAPASLYRKKR